MIEVSKEALKGILPDEETFKLFLTDEELELIKEPAKKMNEKMLGKIEKIKEEMTRGGKVLSIELNPLKEKHPDSKFLKRIKFPVYSVIVKTETGGGGSSAYFLVKGKLKRVPGLESFDRGLKHFRKIQNR